MGIAEQQSKLEDAKIQAFAGHAPRSVPPVAPAGLAKQAALWLLPLGCVVVVSGTIAYVGEQAFERNSSDRYGAREFAAASTASQPRTATQVTDIQLEEVLRAPGDTVLAWRWALLRSEMREAGVGCTRTSDRVSSNNLDEHDPERLAAEVCDSQ
jgi:hypothetical protein